MYKLYDKKDSGNAYKVRLALAQLGLGFSTVEVDSDSGETRTKEFLALNPNGKIPLLELPDGRLLPESNAILFYLAQGSALWPEEPLERAEVLSWMFFEQYSHEPHVAVLRNWAHTGRLQKFADQIETKKAQGHAALSVMERHVARRSFLAAERYTIADVALFAYTHVAPEGGLSLEDYPNLRAWIRRVQEQPGFVPLLGHC